QAFGDLGHDLNVSARAAALILDANLIDQVAPDFDRVLEVHDFEHQRGDAFDVERRFGLGLAPPLGLDDRLVRLLTDFARFHAIGDDAPAARWDGVQFPGDRAGRYVPGAALIRGNEVQSGRQRVHDLNAGRDRRAGVRHFQFETDLALDEALRRAGALELAGGFQHLYSGASRELQ